MEDGYHLLFTEVRLRQKVPKYIAEEIESRFEKGLTESEGEILL